MYTKVTQKNLLEASKRFVQDLYISERMIQLFCRPLGFINQSYRLVTVGCTTEITGAARVFAPGWETPLVPVSQPGAPIRD